MAEQMGAVVNDKGSRKKRLVIIVLAHILVVAAFFVSVFIVGLPS